MRQGAVDIALAHLEATGNVLRGRFTPGREQEEFCDRRILARIHRETISRLRRAIEPVSAATFMRFLFRWQHAAPAAQVRGEGGLLEVVEQIQGFEAAAGAWESEILPLRVGEYRPSAPGGLDDLCLSGEVVWGRFSRRPSNGDGHVNRVALSRNVPISLGLREDLPWLLEEPSADGHQLLGAAGEVLELLSQRGASFLPDIIAGTRRLPSEVENAVWQLAAAGLVTADGFAALRGLVDGTTKRVRQSSRFRRRPRRRRPTSRWSLLQANGTSEEVTEARAAQLLHRYGVIFPEVLARESLAPRWRDLLRVYRRAEARGEIRGGRFVAGFVGEQFALPEAVDKLRTLRKAKPDGKLIAVSASDPLNLVGVLTPGPRVPALLGNSVVFRDGVPLASLQSGEIQFHGDADEATRSAVLEVLDSRRGAVSLSARTRAGSYGAAGRAGGQRRQTTPR